MWVSSVFLCVAGCLLTCSAPSVLAETVPSVSTGEISFDRAMQQTLERNPTLVAAGFQTLVATASVVQAGLRPRPQLGIVVENVAGTGPFSALGGAETTISLGWVIERGKRERRVAVAEAGVSLVDTQRRILRLDIAAETARRFLECLRFSKKLARANESIALAEATLVAIKRRVELGRSPSADLARAEAELSRMRLQREEYEHALRVANWKLAEQWGDMQPAFDSVYGGVERLPSLPDFETLYGQLQRTPDQELFVNEQRLRQSELHLEVAMAKPNWRITTGIRRLETTNDQALVASINIPLGLRNKNQGNIEAAKARVEQSISSSSASLLQKRVRLFAIHQQLNHSLHEAKALGDEIIPKLALALRETRRAYSAGRYGFQELSLARSELLDAEKQQIDAAIQAYSALVEIERLTGLSIESALKTLGDRS